MITQIIKVRNLNVICSADSSACYAETVPDNETTDAKLTDVHQWRDRVVLRCCGVDAEGHISIIKYEGKAKTYVLTVDGLIHRNSNRVAGINPLV